MIAPTEETEHNKERKNAMQNEELEIIRMSEIQMREVGNGCGIRISRSVS